MRLFNLWFRKKTNKALVEIEFSNKTNNFKNIWVEPTCISINLDHKTEYKIVTNDKFFRIEFDKDEQVVFYLQYKFDFKLYKRLVSLDVINQNEWLLDFDYSKID
ncbi:hypothetical protein EON73_03720 [bacterium]|nr:MAG: hypothetical protein EON73_03720 [bacterium]